MSKPIILVPLDGSKQALAALPVAKALGKIERATLYILHVVNQKKLGRRSCAVGSDAKLGCSRALPPTCGSGHRRWKSCGLRSK